MRLSKHRIFLIIYFILILIATMVVDMGSALWTVVFSISTVYLILLAIGSYYIGFRYYLPSVIRLNFPENQPKTIAISFDDGPNDQSTLKLLAILKKHKVKASFFCIGERMEQYPELAKAIVDEGHLLANHSYSHSPFFALSSSRKVQRQIEKTNRIIEQITDTKNLYFRPPFGVTNPIIATVIHKLGMVSVGWSLRSFDTMISKDKLLNKLKVQMNYNEIILMHELEENLDVIDAFIVFAKQQGFRFNLISSKNNEE